MISICSQTIGFTPFSSSWIEDAPAFVVVGATPSGEGCIEIMGLEERRLLSKQKVLEPKAFRCGKIGPSSLSYRSLVTGNFGGSLEVWDIENLSKPVYQCKEAHSGLVNCVSGEGGENVAPEIVSGGREGCVKVWDTRQPTNPVSVFKPEAGQPDCWSVALGNNNSPDRIVAAGFENGDVKIFDLRTMSMIQEMNVGAGVCSVNFNQKQQAPTKLLITAMAAKIHSLSLKTSRKKKKKSANVSASWSDSTVWVGEYLPQDHSIFVTAGGKGTVALWTHQTVGADAKSADSLQMLYESGLTDQPITSLDWNRNKKGLAVCTSLNETVQVIMFTKFS